LPVQYPYFLFPKPTQDHKPLLTLLSKSGQTPVLSDCPLSANSGHSSAIDGAWTTFQTISAFCRNKYGAHSIQKWGICVEKRQCESFL
ncbi:MAG: hypothetical protein WBW27_09695, partial [Pseudolabrys sp.]